MHKPTLKIWLVACLIAYLPFSAHAQRSATCQVQSQPAALTFNQLSTPRDIAIGAAISEERTSAVTFTCQPSRAPGGNGVGFRPQILPTQKVSSTVPDVWETGVPGIGIRVYSVSRGQVVSNGAVQDIGSPIWGRNGGSATFQLRHQLVKTGAITANGQTSFGNVYFFRIQFTLNGGIIGSPRAYVGITGTSVTSRSCTVTTPNVSVTLPNAAPSALQTSGATIGSTGFSIGLQCGADSDVYITLTDSTTPGNRSDLLTLANNSTAQNVRLRVRRPDSTPVSFGPDSPAAGGTNQWRVGPSSGATTIPMTVEYVSTGNATAGTLQGLATFTMSYQ